MTISTFDYDTWVSTPPSHSRVYHDTAYPDGYECRCGCEDFDWDADALAWICEECGEYLDTGRYRIISPEDAAEDERLHWAEL